MVKVLLTKTKAFQLYRLENNILFFDYLDDINIELDDVIRAFELYEEHSENNTNKVLLAFGQYSNITLEARKHAEDKLMPTPAQAIILRNLAQRIFAKFYNLLRKDAHPLKFFKNFDEALDWLGKI